MSSCISPEGSGRRGEENIQQDYNRCIFCGYCVEASFAIHTEVRHFQSPFFLAFDSLIRTIRCGRKFDVKTDRESEKSQRPIMLRFFPAKEPLTPPGQPMEHWLNTSICPQTEFFPEKLGFVNSLIPSPWRYYRGGPQ